MWIEHYHCAAQQTLWLRALSAVIGPMTGRKSMTRSHINFIVQGFSTLRGTRSLSGRMQQATHLPNLRVAYALLHEKIGGRKKIYISLKGVQGVKKVENP